MTTAQASRQADSNRPRALRLMYSPSSRITDEGLADAQPIAAGAGQHQHNLYWPGLLAAVTSLV
jgi:hypothetical protein